MHCTLYKIYSINPISLVVSDDVVVQQRKEDTTRKNKMMMMMKKNKATTFYLASHLSDMIWEDQLDT